MIYYVLGLFSGAFFAIFFLGIFMGRPAVRHEKDKELEAPSYHPDIYRDVDDDWEL